MNLSADYFKGKGIAEIAIIDDYFDPPRREDDNGSVECFWEAVRGDAAAMEELRDLGCDIKDTEDINNRVLRILWENKSGLKCLRSAYENNITPLKKQEDALLKFCACLSDDYGIALTCLGTDQAISETKYKIIVIDYYHYNDT